MLLVNKQGQTRLAKYTDSSLTTDERRALEAEIVRKCLTRVDKQVGQHKSRGALYAAQGRTDLGQLGDLSTQKSAAGQTSGYEKCRPLQALLAATYKWAQCSWLPIPGSLL